MLFGTPGTVRLHCAGPPTRTLGGKLRIECHGCRGSTTLRARAESKRQVLRETELHWQTLEKIRSHDVSPSYQLKRP